MQKFIKRALILSLILIVLVIPKQIVKADVGDSAWGNWNSNNIGSVQDFCATYSHDCTQDGDYIYFATMGNQTNTGAQYQTIGAKISYSGDYIYLGGSGVAESTRDFSYDGTDYVIHQVPLSAIYDNMSSVQKALNDCGRVTVVLDPVYAPLIPDENGVYTLRASIDGVRSKSYHAGDTFESTVCIPREYGYPEWSRPPKGEAQTILENSFKHKLTLTLPPNPNDSSPHNIGLTSVDSSDDCNRTNPVDSSKPFRNVYCAKGSNGEYDKTSVWARSKTPVSLTISGYQPRITSPYSKYIEENSVDYLVTELNQGIMSPSAYYASYKGGRSAGRTPLPSNIISTDLRDNPEINFADTNIVSAGEVNGLSDGLSEIVSATTKTSFATADSSYYLSMNTVSKNGQSAGYSNRLSTIYTDDAGPEWDPLVFSEDGYSSSATFALKNIKDTEVKHYFSGSSGGYFTYPGCGASLVTYKVWGNEQSEPSTETGMMSEKDLEETAGFTSFWDWFGWTSTAKANYGYDLPDKATIINFADTDKFGTSNVVHLQVNAYDNLGNKTTMSYEIKRIYCTPKTTVDLGAATYQEPNSTNKWYSNADKIPVSEITSISKGCSLFADTNTLTLTSDDDSTSTSVISCKENGVSTNNNQFSNNGSLSSTYSTTKDNALISSIRLTSADNLDGKRFNVSGYGEVTYNKKVYKSEIAQEKDGEKVCIDVKNPEISGKIMSGSSVTFVASDSASGLKSVDVFDENSETIIKHIEVSTPSSQVKMVKNGEYIVSIPEQFLKDKITFVATDNVGHTATSSIQNFPYVTGELNANPELDNDGKTVLRVKAKGTTENYLEEYPSSFKYDGAGHKVDGSAQDSFSVTSPKSIDYGVDIPDDVNTTDAPAITQETTTASNVLRWTKLNDVVKHYDLSLTGSPSSNDKLSKIDSKSVDFSSGYDHDEYKIWFVGQGKCDTTAFDYRNSMPLSKPGNTTSQSLDVSKFNEGTYFIRICMRDKNGNPSGYGEFYFYNAPTFNYPVALSVTAVKDVNWKDVAYPLEYSKIPAFVPGPLDPQAQKGKDADKFSLGTNFTASNGGAIHNGYVVNYRIKRVTTGLSSVNVKYEFRDSSGQPLNMSFNGSPLSYYDSSEHTNYTSQVFNDPSSLLEIGTSTDGFLVKHQVPSGSKATYPGTNVTYNGDVSVVAIFTVTLTTGETSPAGSAYEVPLYTITMQTSAEDDISLDPVR